MSYNWLRRVWPIAYFNCGLNQGIRSYLTVFSVMTSSGAVSSDVDLTGVNGSRVLSVIIIVGSGLSWFSDFIFVSIICCYYY